MWPDLTPEELNLGKLPPQPIKLHINDLIKNRAALPDCPRKFGKAGLITNWGSLGNLKYGDCVWAGAAHETMLVNMLAGRAVEFDANCVLSDYTAVTGFNTNDPSTDRGTSVSDAAEYRRTTGIIDVRGKRHKIAAYMALDPANHDHLFLASYLFDGMVGIGLDLPDSAIAQIIRGEMWTPVSGAKSKGGHYVPFIGADLDQGYEYFVSWGHYVMSDTAFFEEYCDEAVAYLSEEALTSRKSPEGFDYDALLDFLKQLGN